MSKYLSKLKSPAITVSIYLLGIVLSFYFLFSFGEVFQKGVFHSAYLVVGLTFLVGLAAINLVAEQKRITTVYLSKKESAELIEAKQDNKKSADSDIEDLVNVQVNSLQDLLNGLCKRLDAGQAAIYVLNENSLELKYGYAIPDPHYSKVRFSIGEGLIGRVASEKTALYIDNLPQGYITVFSGLGSASPTYLTLVPIISNEMVHGVMELATFRPLNENTRQQLQQIGSTLPVESLHANRENHV